jgi:hypothetical protein
MTNINPLDGRDQMTGSKNQAKRLHGSHAIHW